MDHSLYSYVLRSVVASVAAAFLLLAPAASAQTTQPVVYPSNPSCADVDQDFGETWLDYKIEPVKAGITKFDNGDIAGSITVDKDVESFSFTVTPGVDAVIVKGTPSGNVYVYDVDATSGSNLQAPGGAGLSHISFCYDLKGAISGKKFHDLDADGTHDADEPTLSGWKLYLDLDNDGDRDANEPIATTDANGLYSFGDLAFTTYTVRELPADQQPNTTLTQCSTPVPCSFTFTLTAKDRTKVGNFGNYAPAKLTVVKQTNPDGAAGSFAFSSNVPGNASFNLSDGQSRGPVSVKPGDYTATEDVPNGWTLDSIVCTGDLNSSGSGQTATFRLISGEDVTCTFTNTKLATIEIEKQTLPDETNGSTFDFTPSGNLGAGFGLADDGVKTYANVTPNTSGAYTVSEGAAPGYRLTGVACDDDDSVESLANRNATIKVSAGETVRCTFTNTKIAAAIQIVKTGTTEAHHGDLLTYNFAVTNTGNSPLHDVVVTDDRCAPVNGPVSRTNDDGDALLEPIGTNGTSSEVWNYTCSYNAPADHVEGEPNPIHNVATVTGKDEEDKSVTDTDDHDTLLIHPDIELDKKVRRASTDPFVDGPITAGVGDTIEYRFTVTNAGDTALAVEFSDSKCDAGTLTAFSGDTDSDGKLDVTETWSATCTRVLTAADGTPLVNVATVKGTDSLGGTDTDSDTATVDILPPPPPPPATGQVLPEAVVSGVSRLTGPSGCVSKRFTARVTGRRIASAVFRIDGKVVKRFRSASGEATRVNLRVNPARYGRGTHRLTIRVRYNRASQTAAKTLRMTFARCARTGARPRFTG